MQYGLALRGLRVPLLLLVLVLSLFSSALARSATGPHTLVVLDDPAADKSRLSAFFASLEAQGLQLTFKGPKEEKPALGQYDRNNFDHLLLMAPSAKALSSDLTPQKVVNFLRTGGNVLFALSPSLSESYRDLAREFSLEFEERGTSVLDHFSHVPSLDGSKGAKHAAILAGPKEGEGVVPNPIVFSPATLSKAASLPILYRGVGHKFAPNPLAFPLLVAPSTSYSADPSESLDAAASTGGLAWYGADSDSALVSGFQLKDNSARAVWSGSVELFEDAFWKARNVKDAEGNSHPGTLNSLFALDLISWLTQSHGVLRIDSVTHERVRAGDDDVREEYEEFDEETSEKRVQKMYRINDTVVYSVELSQHTADAGWGPAPADLDLQVSAIMLDPYVTASLSVSPSSLGAASGIDSELDASAKQTSSSTRYSTTFRLPDKHGVFTFELDWSRHGWSYLFHRHRAPVRPFNSDEHPRFLSAAWPYVAGSFSTIVAFVVFSALWLTTKEHESNVAKGKKQQ